MKNFKKVMSLLLVAMLLFTLVACGGKDGGSDSKAKMVGTYSLSGMSDEEGETSQEDLELLLSLGMTITLELKEDNTGTLSMFDESVDLTWDESKITIEGESTEYTFDGTTLTMEEDGVKMEFTKDAEE